MKFEFMGYGLLYFEDKQFYFKIIDDCHVYCSRESVPLPVRIRLLGQIYDIPIRKAG